MAKNSILSLIPGFKTNKTWKKIIALIYYVFTVFMLFIDGIGTFLFVFSMPFVVFSIINLILNKKYDIKPATATISLVISIVLLGTGLALMEEPKENNTSYNGANLTEEEYLYCDEIVSQSTKWSNSFKNLGNLLTNPQLEDDNWYIELLNEATIMQGISKQAKEMTTVPIFESTHKKYLEGVENFEWVAGQLVGISSKFTIEPSDVDLLEECLDKMENAMIPIAEAGEEMEKIIVDKDNN